jgi:murein DD-endopeptidase MepM/ murein hydrolase activator NlpD
MSKSVFSLVLQILLITNLSETLFAQNSDKLLSIRTENNQGFVHFYATNHAYSDLQVELSILEQDGTTEIEPLSYQIIPAQSRNMLFKKIKIEKNFRYRYKYVTGNPQTVRHNSGYIYKLPYGNGLEFKVIQGYNGAFSHQGKFALDFAMPEGTAVHAARGGIVIRLKTDSDQGSDDPELANAGNYVTILHDDGSLASYVHLRKGGTVVSAGDRVKDGQIIGYSGNTGYSTEPHLHFEVKIPVYMDTKTVPVKFKTGVSQTEVPEPGKFYRSWH